MGISYTFILNGRPDRFGLYRIYLRIIASRVNRKVKTDISVQKSEFNSKPSMDSRSRPMWINRKNKDYERLNLMLANVLRDAQEHQTTLEKKGQSVSSESLKNQIQRPSEATTIADFAQHVLSHINGSFHYKKHVKSRLTIFANWAGKNALLKDVNLEMLNRFKIHLATIPVSSTTQHFYFARIKRMITVALNLELIDRDPFRNFEMPAERPGSRIKLSDVQIASLEKVVAREDTWLWRAKWLYLFSFRKAGIRSADVIQLRIGNIDIEHNRLDYQMDKTGKAMSLKLTPADWQLIRLFWPEGEKRPAHSYLFGLLDDNAPYAEYMTFEQKAKMPEEIDRLLYNKIGSIQTLINRSLKELADKAGVAGKLTFHTARHSFADKARRRMKETKNISVDDIRNALGHTRLDTTQRYLNSFDKEGLDSAMDAVFGE